MRITFSNLMDKHAKPHSIRFDVDKAVIAHNEVYIDQDGMSFGIATMDRSGDWHVNQQMVGKSRNNRATSPKNPYNHIEVSA